MIMIQQNDTLCIHMKIKLAFYAYREFVRTNFPPLFHLGHRWKKEDSVSDKFKTQRICFILAKKVMFCFVLISVSCEANSKPSSDGLTCEACPVGSSGADCQTGMLIITLELYDDYHLMSINIKIQCKKKMIEDETTPMV